MFKSLKKKFSSLGKGFEEAKKEKPSLPLREKKVDELLWELEIGLLESDVAYPVVEEIKRKVKAELYRLQTSKRDAPFKIRETLKGTITEILSSSQFDFYKKIEEQKPFVIMFVGVNGSGKTTAIAKLAWDLINKGKSCVLGACDTFRAGAIEQLALHANRVGVKLIKHKPGADPAAVAYDAIEHAKAKGGDVVLLDTAGRMHTNVNLMDEMAKIKRVAKPHLTLFVGDALTGNDAVEQAKRFDEAVGIDGTILTKIDVDAKGGSALSIAYTAKKPLLFIGTGQEYKDQILFDPKWMANRIFAEEA
jgi:fused signal recognition particle receptor